MPKHVVDSGFVALVSFYAWGYFALLRRFRGNVALYTVILAVGAIGVMVAIILTGVIPLLFLVLLD